jgi:hypothetical protein
MRHNETLSKFKQYLRPGCVYRRTDLAEFSSNVDRHLARLVAEGYLKKLSHGLYMTPKQTAFGDAPPEADSLLRTFLKDDHFVVYSPNQFNSLGLGTTQLYNRLIVFNRKRVGEFTLGGRTYLFHRWRDAPKKLTPEFLVVELLNRLNQLAEDREQIIERLGKKLSEFDRKRLLYSAHRFGTISTQKKLKALMNTKDVEGIG